MLHCGHTRAPAPYQKKSLEQKLAVCSGLVLLSFCGRSMLSSSSSPHTALDLSSLGLRAGVLVKGQRTAHCNLTSTYFFYTHSRPPRLHPPQQSRSPIGRLAVSGTWLAGIFHYRGGEARHVEGGVSSRQSSLKIRSWTAAAEEGYAEKPPVQSLLIELVLHHCRAHVHLLPSPDKN